MGYILSSLVARGGRGGGIIDHLSYNTLHQLPKVLCMYLCVHSTWTHAVIAKHVYSEC